MSAKATIIQGSSGIVAGLSYFSAMYGSSIDALSLVP